MAGFVFHPRCTGAHCAGVDTSLWKGSAPPTIEGRRLEELLTTSLPRREGDDISTELRRFVWFHCEVHKQHGVTQNNIAAAVGRSHQAIRLMLTYMRKVLIDLSASSACEFNPEWDPFRPESSTTSSTCTSVPASSHIDTSAPASLQDETIYALHSIPQPTDGITQDDRAWGKDPQQPEDTPSEESDSPSPGQPSTNVTESRFQPVNGTQRQREARTKELARLEGLEKERVKVAHQEELQQRKDRMLAEYRAKEPQRRLSIEKRNKELLERDLQEMAPDERQSYIEQYERDSSVGYANLSNVRERRSEPEESKEPEESEESEESEWSEEPERMEE